MDHCLPARGWAPCPISAHEVASKACERAVPDESSAAAASSIELWSVSQGARRARVPAPCDPTATRRSIFLEIPLSRSLPARDTSDRTARTELGNLGERQTTHLQLLERVTVYAIFALEATLYAALGHPAKASWLARVIPAPYASRHGAESAATRRSGASGWRGPARDGLRRLGELP
jgi:hypothetical protein